MRKYITLVENNSGVRAEEFLKQICNKMGLSLRDGPYAIGFDETTREASIDIYDELPMDKIMAFADIGEGLRITPGPDYLTVIMILHHGVEN